LSGYDIAGWAGFLAVAAGVPAMLTGLIFGAISINLARILEFPRLPEFAAETIVQLRAAMIISLIALASGQSALVLGVKLAVGGAILWILQTSRARSNGCARSKTMTSAVQSSRSY